MLTIERSSSRFVLFAITAVLGGRTMHAQESVRIDSTTQARVRAAAGCYRVTRDAWSKPSHLGPAQSTELFRLDTVPTRPEFPGSNFAAVRLVPVDSTSAQRAWRQPASWQLAGTDSIEVTMWTTGFEAESFYGRVNGASLEGVMRLTSDALPVDPKTHAIVWDGWPWARATARRVACP